MLSAAGFRPDVPNKTLTIMPSAPGEFRIPWVAVSGFGTISRMGQTLSVSCAYGQLELKALKLGRPATSVRMRTRTFAARTTATEGGVTVEFVAPVIVRAVETLEIHD